jgi:beta-glucosidase
LVREGKLKKSQLDALVAPMLYYKFKLGLFDDPFVDPLQAERIVGCEDNRKLALQAAREAVTRLKNDYGLVPLKPDRIKSVAV